MKVWLGYALLVLAIFVTFALLLAGPIQAQRCETIVVCWKDTFPCWERPWTVPLWTALASLEVFRYCFEPIGQALLPLAVAGAISFWRRGLRTLLALLLLPIALPLGAAYLQAYPFCGSRVLVYLMPVLALLIAEGLPLPTGANMPKQPTDPTALQRRSRLRALCRTGVLALALSPLVWAVHRVIDPWKRADCAGAAHYVLAHRQPTDSVAANHWEYLYYFRRLGSGFCLLGQAAPVQHGRLWLIATATTPADRLEILNHFGRQGWHSLEEHEFMQTSVVLLSKLSHRSLSEP